MTEPKLSLHRKLAQIMYEAERIPKNGRAPKEMGGYPFVQVGDAADYIRKALAEKVITMIPTGVQVVGQADRPTKSGGTMTTVDLITTWTLTDGETGESIQIQSFGAGADGGDKYSGKASTSAMKYALLTGFLLSTGEDSELGHTEAGRRTDPAEHVEKADEPTREREPTEVFLGKLTTAGTVKKGSAEGYKLDARMGPDGWVIGFRLERSDGKAIPQVLADGPLGTSLYTVLGGEPAELLGKRVTVKGHLYNVSNPGRQSYYRMHLTGIKTDEWEIPAPEPPVEAPTTPLFDETEQDFIFAAVDKAGAA